MNAANLAFLLVCLRCRFDLAAWDAGRTSAPTSPTDWEAVHRAIYDEGLAPLVYTIVRGQGWFPAALEADLAAAYESNATRNTGFFFELELALAALAQADIPVILLKGAALAETIYGNAAVRPLADGDLLVRPAAVPQALETLAQLGYVRTDPEPRPGDALRFENQIELRKTGPFLARIEIHWSLLDSPFYQARLPLDWFWDTSVPLQVDAAAARGLGLEANLLYLSAHLILHHRGEGLMWWHDIAEIIHAAGGQVDWPALLGRGQACDLVLPLQQVLPRLAADWDAAIPADTLARLAELRPSAAERRVYAWLTAAERPVAQRFRADLASLPGWGARLRYAWSSLFPAPAYMRQRYAIAHPQLTWLYYPYRWWLGLRSFVAKDA